MPVAAPPAVATPHPLRRAMEARDLPAAVATLAPDVVLRSPATAVAFTGRQAVGELLGLLMQSLDELEYVDELAAGETLVLGFRARVAGRSVDGVDVLRLDPEGRVREIVVYARPLAGAAAFLAAVGPKLAGRHGRLRALAVRAAAGPLPGLLARFDALGTRVARPGVRRGVRRSGA